MADLFRNVIIAERYAHHRDTHDEDFVDLLASMFDPEAVVVDIGAGAGAPAAAMIRRGLEVLAVEPSAAMIAQGMRRHPYVAFLKARGEDLPLPDASVGGALVMYVLHHADDPVRLLAEARRVVTPGGPIVVVTGRSDSARQYFFREYFPTLTPELPAADEIWEWGTEAGLFAAACTRAVHRLYPYTHIDVDYLEMIECDMFAALRVLNPREFDAGLRRLRTDLGRPVPPPEVYVIGLVDRERTFVPEPATPRSALLI